MGLNIRGKKLLHEEKATRCEKCEKIYAADCCYCPRCGSKLISEKMQIFANFGKNGITSYTYKLPNGISFNSKGNVTMSLAKGISYTSKIKK